MSCIDLQDTFVEYLLGELDASSKSSVEQHLKSGCRTCNREMTLLTEATDLLWQAKPNTELSADLQLDILAKVRAMPPSISIAKPGAFPLPGATLFARFGSSPRWQAALAFAAGLLLMICVDTSLQFDNSPTAEAGRAQRTLPNVSFRSSQIPTSLHMSEKKYDQAHLVSLRQKPDSNEVRGHILWDTLNREIHIFCFGLAPSLDGNQYAVWLFGTGTQVRIVDRLDMDSRGVHKAAVRWPEGDFQLAKVTLESTEKLSRIPSEIAVLTSSPIHPLAF